MAKYDDDLIIRLKQDGKTWADIGDLYDISGENMRNYARSKDWYNDIKDVRKINDTKKDEYEKKSVAENGVITSNIKKRLDDKLTFSEHELLELHSLNADEFKIKTITSNEWSMTNAEGQQYYNFQSKIIAEPKKFEITANHIASLFEEMETRHIELNYDVPLEQYLLIPLSDMHFGWNNMQDYEQLQKKISDIIENQYAEILFTLHGDFFHVDNFLNTTEFGTKIDDVDLTEGVEDGYNFLLPLLEKALKNSPYVKLVYLKGNHAPSIDYVFVNGIKRLYPDVEVDDGVSEYKHAWLGDHSIFSHHGDKRRTTPKLLEVIVSDFAKEWGESKSRYLITGHLHHEKSLSNAGLTHYQVQSPSKATSYDKKKGFTTSETGLMIFEFDKHKRSAIYFL